MTRQAYGAIKAVVIQAEAEGLTVREAAKRFGFSPRSIRSAASHAQATLRRERRPLGSVKELVLAGVDAGLTVPQIAEASGVSPHNLYSALRRLGIAPQPARRGRSTL